MHEGDLLGSNSIQGEIKIPVKSYYTLRELAGFCHFFNLDIVQPDML